MMRLTLAILISKLTRFALRLLKRGGTALPGKIALAICPDMLARLSRDIEIAVVTGTNGKTTTARMLEAMLLDAGLDCFANRSGSNLEQGIAAEFAANATLTGRPKRRCAVIECDEAAFRTVAGKLRPRVIIVTNLFRDQLDRYGEVTNTLHMLWEGISTTPDSVLCLNADCPLTASLAEGVKNPVQAFGLSVTPPGTGASGLSDAPRCVRCGGAYEYEYRSFAQLGGFRCPDCGYARQSPAVDVRAIRALGEDASEVTISVGGEDIDTVIALPAVYNIYNAAAALAAATAMGLPAAGAAASLAQVKSGFGRMERFDLNGVPVMLILIKNPAGCDRAIDYLCSLPGGFTLALCLNDNFADGTDVSWIWDAAFERLLACDERAGTLIVSGTRAEDMRLRLKYAGADERRVALIKDSEALVEAIANSEKPVYVLPTYTAMLPLRATLSKRCGVSDFWE